MTKGNWEKDGYMTLEASFIMPITVILITALMYLSFYLYTVAFLNQAAYIAAFRASLCDEGNAEAEAAAARELDKLLKESVLPIKGLENKSMFLQFPSVFHCRPILRFRRPGCSL